MAFAGSKREGAVMPAKTAARKTERPRIDGVLSLVLGDSDLDGAEAFVRSLDALCQGFGVGFVVGWMEGAEAVEEEPEPDDEDDDEELDDDDYEDDGDESDGYTSDDLEEMDSDELRELLDELEIELDGRFGKQKAIKAILADQ